MSTLPGTLAGGATLDAWTVEGAEAAGPPEELRYAVSARIAEGGTSEIFRAQDAHMGRAVAMKVLRPALADRGELVTRFFDEARLTGRLDHPGVVPVYDIGHTSDGRPCFTMREVHGQTLGDLILAVHAASGPRAWGETPGGWTLPRLIDAWRRVCETLAYAHAEGVIHRDLKPENIMVGPFGEVLVMDWGLARDHADLRAAPARIAGTPTYMAPEQATGGVGGIDARADVYALGLLLYAILYAQPPRPPATTAQQLAWARAGWIAPPPERGRPVPDDLVQIWQAATAAQPADRPADAGALAARVRAFQEGAEKRRRAAALVSQAAVALTEADQRRTAAERAASAAAERARRLLPWSPLDEKRPVWEAEDEAAAALAAAEAAEVRGTELLRAALAEDPTAHEARAALADRYQARHAEAERRRDSAAAARWETLLRATDDGAHAGWLRGEALLCLHTAPRARALLYRLERRDRRMVEQFVADLGRTPIVDHPLPHGSYVIELHAPGHAQVRYPVQLGRGGRWDATPPGGHEAAPIVLPPASAVGRHEVYVPEGWCEVGGDPLWSASGPRQRVWVDAFIIDRHPVSNTRWMAFLDALVQAGQLDRAEACAPRWQPTAGEAAPVMVRGADGRHQLQPDPDGDTWAPDWPVFLIDQHAARAFAAHEAARTGLPYRLPYELEWEKAARGVDARAFPWGDALELSLARVRGSAPGRVLPAPVGAHPLDCSVYGVQGMAGNVQDWCLDRFVPGGAPVQGGRPAPQVAGAEDEVTVRGGAWNFPGDVASCAFRTGRHPSHRRESLGVRLVRPWNRGQ